MQPITYDRYGRMNYNPEFHFNHKKPISLEELEYLCRFYDIDGCESISFALGRTEKSIYNIVCQLKKEGLFDHYKNMRKHWAC